MSIFDVSKINENDLEALLAYKTDEIGSLMSYYCSAEEVEAKKQEVMNRLKALEITYYDKKNAVDTLKEVGSNLDYQDLEDKLKEDETRIDSLLNNDLSFIREFIKNKDSKGLEYNDGEQRLFSGINRAFEYSTLYSLRGKRDRNGEPFELPEELVEYEEDFANDVRIRDSVTHDLGEGAYRMFFKGEGNKLYEGLSKAFGSDTVVPFNRMVDESTYNKNDSFYSYYSKLVEKMDPKTALSEMQVEKSKPMVM